MAPLLGVQLDPPENYGRREQTPSAYQFPQSISLAELVLFLTVKDTSWIQSHFPSLGTMLILEMSHMVRMDRLAACSVAVPSSSVAAALVAVEKALQSRQESA